MSNGWLWSDQLFIGLLLTVFILSLYGLRKTNHRLVMHRFFQKPIAVSSSMILFFFLAIGVLDSIPVAVQEEKFAEHPTLLDYYLSPLNEVDEKTYSSPFALTLYTSETVLAGGIASQIHPRLIYPSNKFQQSKEVYSFIFKTIGFIFISTVGVILTLYFIGYFLFRKKYITFWLTLGLGLFLVLSSYVLSREFHILGTGKIGQDIFYYAVKSIRTGLIIGTLTTLFMMPLALFLGVIAGYFGGLLDDIIQYIYTTLSSVPGVLLITASVLSMQTYIAMHPQQFTTLAQSADARLLALCFILGLTSWTNLCRLIRAEVLKLREIDFVLAAVALGSSAFKIIVKHLLPNVTHLVVMALVLDFSFLILAEAVLAYVGVGVSPMTISWGNMINAARLELSRDPIVWWPMVAAFSFMFALVISSNVFADALRDAFDPRHEI